MDYRSSNDIEKSLDLTEQLMLGYYREYGLVWDRSKRRECLGYLGNDLSNPYDGHTLNDQLHQVDTLTGKNRKPVLLIEGIKGLA